MPDQNRRHFNRVSFDTDATLQADGQVFDCHLLDVSIKGALVALKTETVLDRDAIYHLEIPLSGNDEKIMMELTLVHQEQSMLGLECQHIDLDSITHLRRLIELNLGDSNLVERDFEALCSEN